MNSQEKGIYYEKFIKSYLQSQNLHKRIFLWNEIPEQVLIDYGFISSHNCARLKRKEKYENPLMDTGIDLIQIDDNNIITVIQCKNGYEKGLRIDDLSGFSFWIHHLEYYKNNDDPNMNYNYVVYYTSTLSNPLKSFRTKINYIKLEPPPQPKQEELCEELKTYYIKNTVILDCNKIILNNYIPYNYQLEAVNAFNNLFINRGILNLPCGVGKTYVSYLYSTPKYNQIILISPLKEFALQNLNNYIKYGYKSPVLLIDSDYSGTRDLEHITHFITSNNSFIISTTYDSLDIIIKLHHLFNNVLFIVDEFHNISITNLTKKDDPFYQLIFNENNKIMFLSATPRVYELENYDYTFNNDKDDNDNDKDDKDDNDEENEDDDEDDDEENEDDDEEDEEDDNDEEETTTITSYTNSSNNYGIIDTEYIFGNIIYKMSFTEAIKNNYICDYIVWLPSISEDNDELYQELSIYNITNNEIKLKCIYLFSCLTNNASKKCIIYCKSVDEIEEFKNYIEILNDFYCLDINIQVITSCVKNRTQILKNFQSINNNIQLLFSVRILDECIDIDSCDSIFITYPSKSKIRTIQRLCRCIRKDKNNIHKIGNIFIWSSDYDEIVETISSIKEYDINFNTKIKVNSIDFYKNKNYTFNNKIELDNNKIQNLIIGIKEFKILSWNEKLQKVKTYIDKHNKLPSQYDKIQEVKTLRLWLNRQKTNYKKNTYVMKNNTDIKTEFENFLDKYKKYFETNEKIWYEKLEQVKKYIDDNNKLPSCHNKIQEEVKKLGQWLDNQKKNYKNTKIMQNNTDIKTEFKNFLDEYDEHFETNEEIWYENLEQVKKYIDDNNKLPSCHNKIQEEVKKLGQWLDNQKKNYKKNTYIMQNNNDIKTEFEKFCNEYNIII